MNGHRIRCELAADLPGRRQLMVREAKKEAFAAITAVFAAAANIPKASLHFPYRCKENAWILRVQLDVDSAGLVAFVQNPLPVLTAIK